MRIDEIERAIKQLDDGGCTNEPLPVAVADAILESRIVSVDQLAEATGEANAAALRLFAEVGLAQLGVHMSPGDDLRGHLERFRREQREGQLARVSPEPLEQWSSAMVRRAIQMLGRPLLADAIRESYLDAARAGLASADAIKQRFADLIDDGVDILRAKYQGVEAATTGRATRGGLVFLKARVDDGTYNMDRYLAWSREQYLIAMYGRTVRTKLAVDLAADVDLESVTEDDMARGRVRDLLIDPKHIWPEDLPLIDEATARGLISKVERDEALRAAMFHQFEQGAAGNPIAVELELALGFLEWSQPSLREARRRGVELELRLLREGRKISAEQMEYLEASVVRGLLSREELDPIRTAVYLELRYGPAARPEAAELLRGYSNDAVWLERLPTEKPCWVGDVDLGTRLRGMLGAQATAFRAVAEAIIDWLPLAAEPGEALPAFDRLVAAFEAPDTPNPHRALESLRTLPVEVVRIGLARARPILRDLPPPSHPLPPRIERPARLVRRSQSWPRPRIERRLVPRSPSVEGRS